MERSSSSISRRFLTTVRSSEEMATSRSTEGSPAISPEIWSSAASPQAVHAFADDGADLLLLREPSDAFITATQNWADQVSHVPDLGDHLAADPAILTFYGEDAAMTEIYEETRAQHPELRVSRYWSEYLSCRRVSFQPTGIDKGSGVLDVAQRIGAQPEECMVFGDWHNDRPMFEIGAVGVAMADAVDELKQMADYVTDANSDQDGVARFLAEAFL